MARKITLVRVAFPAAFGSDPHPPVEPAVGLAGDADHGGQDVDRSQDVDDRQPEEPTVRHHRASPVLPLRAGQDLAGVPETARVKEVAVRRPGRGRAAVAQRGQFAGLHEDVPFIRSALT